MRYLNPLLISNYFRFAKTDGRHIGILSLVSILTYVQSSACDFASACQISSRSDHRRRSYDVLRFFRMADIESESYIRLRFYWLHTFMKVKIYLKSYFRFRFWPMFSLRYAILLQPAKYRRNQAIHGRVMTSYRFFKVAAIKS